ncbi:MAG: hypothetical protein RLZ98_3056 [Pseudomonadota bacterium]|jgi:tripartite-type tricarboxylate transporter receptor subunit TctC
MPQRRAIATSIWENAMMARLAVTAIVAASTITGASAQSVADFYKGKQILLIVGSAAGGGYDAYGRLLSRHLSGHIPGNPSIVVQNMPGAGQNKAASFVYQVAAKDGTVMGGISPGAALTPVLGGPKITHDPSRFQYIGSVNSDVYTCVARTDAPIKSFKEVFEKEMIMGMSGGTTQDMPALLKNVLGAKLKLVAGYPGTKDISLALERGEVHGFCGYGYASLMSRNSAWITSGKVRILAQETVKGHADMNKQGIPKTIDFAKTDEQRKILSLVYNTGIYGRPYVMAPEVPKDRVAAMRKFFMATVTDPNFVADAAKRKLDLDPLPGEEVQKLIAEAYATPKELIAKTLAALGRPAAKN